MEIMSIGFALFTIFLAIRIMRLEKKVDELRRARLGDLRERIEIAAKNPTP